MKTFLHRLAVISAAGMFFVLLMGALVTKTDSGRGCGDDWPLCHGKFVPNYTIESFIEYSHRFVSGIEGLLVLLTFILVVLKMGVRRDAKLYAGVTLFFTVLQAIMGALAVVRPHSAPIMALHFGFSLMAVAAALLLAVAVKQWDGSRTQLSGFVRRLPGTPEAQAVDPGMRWAVWGTTIYSYMVVYIGAFVTHTESARGCSGWPTCNGDWIPPLTGAPGIAFMHRVAAFVLLVLVLYVSFRLRRECGTVRIVRLGAAWAAVLIVLQVLSGALLVFSNQSDWYLVSNMIHTTFIATLFSVLSFLSMVMWQLRKPRSNS